MRFLGQYSHRIVVACPPDNIEKTTRQNESFSAADLIDENASSNLPRLFNHIGTDAILADPAFKPVSENSKSELENWGKGARKVLDWMKEDNTDFFPIYGNQIFNEGVEVDEYWPPVSGKAWCWYIHFGNQNGQPRIGSHQIPQTLSFRILLYQVLCLYWYRRTAGPLPENPDRLANDLTDMTYCAVASYFDGLITCDSMVNKVFPVGKKILEKFNEQTPVESLV